MHRTFVYEPFLDILKADSLVILELGRNFKKTADLSLPCLIQRLPSLVLCSKLQHTITFASVCCINATYAHEKIGTSEGEAVCGVETTLVGGSVRWPFVHFFLVYADKISPKIHSSLFDCETVDHDIQTFSCVEFCVICPDLWPVLRIALPGAAMLCAEWWAFEILTLLAGLLSTTDLASSAITMNVETFAFMFPLTVSIAASTRISNNLGEGEWMERAANLT